MSIRTLKKVLLLAVASAVIPACGGSDESTPPSITRGLPAFDATGVAHFPLILLEFDRAMDASSMSGNIVLYLTNPITGVHTTPFGPGATLHYIPGTFQVAIENNAAFAASTEYAVVIFPGLRSAEGASILALPTGSLAHRFVVGNSGNTERPSFNVPTQVAGGAQGEIFWQWSEAQEGNPLGNIAATYDLYKSSATDSQDLFTVTASPSTFPNFTTPPATPGATYFFLMVARDNQGNVRLTAQFQGVANP